MLCLPRAVVEGADNQGQFSSTRIKMHAIIAVFSHITSTSPGPSGFRLQEDDQETMSAPCISSKCVVLQAGQNFRFSNFWRQTFVRSCIGGQGAFSARREVRVEHLYSDVLYSSWHWAHAKLRPEWLDGDTIPRIAASELSLQHFIDEFEQPNRPVIITGLVRPAAICP